MSFTRTSISGNCRSSRLEVKGIKGNDAEQGCSHGVKTGVTQRPGWLVYHDFQGGPCLPQILFPLHAILNHSSFHSYTSSEKLFTQPFSWMLRLKLSLVGVAMTIPSIIVWNYNISWMYTNVFNETNETQTLHWLTLDHTWSRKGFNGNMVTLFEQSIQRNSVLWFTV